MTHDPRAVLEALAASLDAGEVLSRFPGLAREQLRGIVREAAGRLPRAAARSMPAPAAAASASAAAPRCRRVWPEEVTVHIDGGARGNPGEAGVGVYFQDRSGAPLQSIARYIGRATNNTAEYQALLIALARARDAGVKHLRVFSDSELLVNQVNGRYRTTVPHLQQYLQEAIRLMREIGRVDVAHVRREHEQGSRRARQRGDGQPRWLTNGQSRGVEAVDAVPVREAAGASPSVVRLRRRPGTAPGGSQARNSPCGLRQRACVSCGTAPVAAPGLRRLRASSLSDALASARCSHGSSRDGDGDRIPVRRKRTLPQQVAQVRRAGSGLRSRPPCRLRSPAGCTFPPGVGAGRAVAGCGASRGGRKVRAP